MSAILSGVLSGVLLVVCFPRFDFHLAAWVALVPLLHHVSRSGFRQAVAGGAAMGVVFHLANLYWIANVMVRYGGLDRPVGFAVLLALVGYLTLFTAAFGGLTAAACRLGGFRALFVTPVFWVGLELLRNYPFGGFPWCLLGYSQVSVLPILQLASITGIHGISFLLVLVNALIAYWLTGPGKKSILLSAAPVGAALAGVLAYGHAELSRPLPATSLRVAAVQGNVLQEQKWDPGYAARISADHLMLSVEAAGQGARLIAWPESSTPFHFDSTPALANRIRTFVREKEVYLLFGSDDYEFPSSDGTGDYRAFNGAKLLTPEGRAVIFCPNRLYP
ncbi:MAG: apolipoprotein N-acyltransferase, partial [Acidobacteriota bacterium]